MMFVKNILIIHLEPTLNFAHLDKTLNNSRHIDIFWSFSFQYSNILTILIRIIQ